ncbi:Nif3-like dinuclear metal center hexameric protein [Larkinella sp. VNQ87]|uniref:Nif3-like dinuclear metal center hexameric protein n=1 Tax=Larkinella sp. VNQ87 TaxID=3400921 RepID=UPI003C09D8D7
MRLTALLDFLAVYFKTADYAPEERGGIYILPNPDFLEQPVEPLGVALDPWPGLPDWLTENRIRTLWMHRPWQLDPAVLPEDVTVLFHHLPFDEQLTLGYNQPLADALGLPWTDAVRPEPLGYKQSPGLPNRPIGMVGTGPALDFGGWCQRSAEQFGGYDEAVLGTQPLPGRIAVVGAMNDALIREAAERKVSLYITGQYRKSARKAVAETGMAVIAVGHRRSEEWGLQRLSDILCTQALGIHMPAVPRPLFDE